MIRSGYVAVVADNNSFFLRATHNLAVANHMSNAIARGIGTPEVGDPQGVAPRQELRAVHRRHLER